MSHMARHCLAVLATGLTAAAGTAPACARTPPSIAIPDAGHVLAPPRAPENGRGPAQAPGQNLGLPGAGAGTIHFANVRIHGAHVVDPATIAAVFAPLRGRDITADALKTALDRVDALYRLAGYPLGRAYVPAQVMRDGQMVVRVVEGYVAHIAIQADSERTHALIAGIAAHLTEEKPLTGATLQRYMLIIQGLPGITVGSKFQSMDPQTGATTLVISASFKPVTASFYFDNRANLDRLPFQPYVIGAANNLFGAGDQLSLTALLSPRQKEYAFYDLGYSQLVGTDGLSMGLNASWAQTLDSRSYRPYGIRSQTSQLSYNARYPVLRATDRQLDIDGMLYFTHAGYSFSSVPIAHDNFAAARIGGEVARSLSPDLAIGGNLHLTLGLADIGPQPHTRAAVPVNFTKLQGETRLSYRPAPDLAFNLRAGGQYGPASLYASEEITFGGLQYGRGFDTAEISGDSGFGVSFQPEYTISLDGTESTTGPGWRMTPYLLADYAKAYNTRGDRQADGELVSTGVGLRLLLPDLVTATIEVDKPLNRTPLYQRHKDPRFYFGLQFGLDRAYSLIGETR